MLDELIVENLGIIEHAHLEPGAGFVVISGETGAGKTMLLGALRLLMGTQSRREFVGAFGAEAVVDGRLVLAGDEVTLRRRVTGEGRSKAYVDGAMVPAKALSERTEGHIEVVGQHDHMLLTSATGARILVDGALEAGGKRSREDYRLAWDALVEMRQRLELLGGSRRELERELEVVRFQAEEIAAAGFSADEEEELNTRVARLRNAEQLASGFGLVFDAVGDDGAAAELGRAAAELSRLSRLDESLRGAGERLDAIIEELGELQVDLARTAADLEHEPGELDTVEERVHTMHQLQRKYGETLAEVLEFGAGAEARAGELTRLLSTADQLGAEVEAAGGKARDAAEDLSAARRKAAASLEKRTVAHLKELGMTAPLVEFDFIDAELGPEGADRIQLLFASDSSLTPAAATRIASGGELSRLTLSLRLAAGIGDATVLAFDEVDAGIGGATALAMGEKLAALGAGRQLFCVTHLPQVAAHADTHYVVARSGNRAEVRKVAGGERLEELSRMLGGLPDSERGQLHAAELLASARRPK
jgi:DNA repair protein RecN (Recombination protein N)